MKQFNGRKKNLAHKGTWKVKSKYLESKIWRGKKLQHLTTGSSEASNAGDVYCSRTDLLGLGFSN